MKLEFYSVKNQRKGWCLNIVNETTETRVLLGGAVELRLFGRNNGATDWGIATLTEETARRPTPESQRTYGMLHGISCHAYVPVLYAPKPSTFNAVICPHDALRVSLMNSHEDLEGDPPYNNLVLVCRGVDADGCDIPVGHAFYIASADCPTIIARSATSGTVIAAHAGRDCLVDRARLKTGNPSRPHESVVDAIVDFFHRKFSDKPGDLEVVSVCGIAAHNFSHPLDHPTYGDVNRNLVSYMISTYGTTCIHGNTQKGCLDLHNIIRAQFERRGVPGKHIQCDTIDTYGDCASDDNHRWWSNARAQTPQERAKRNGVMVIRRF